MPMSYSQMIKALCDERATEDVPGVEESQQIFGAMLDGGIPELELGALLIALATRPASLDMRLGFGAALASRVHSLPLPEGESHPDLHPIVIPAYGAARAQRNLAPLVALILQRLHIPVLVHGTLEGHGGVASAYIFRELGVMPCMTLAQAGAALARDRLAFVPTGVIAPGLAQLLALHRRLGTTGICLAMASLLDPFNGAGMRVVAADHAADLDGMRELLLAEGGAGLLMQGTEGEAFVNPRRRPRIELVRDGASTALYEQEAAHDIDNEWVEADFGARATAAWMRRVLAGHAALPQPIINQLACCLYAAGHSTDLNEAKAIVAVETRSLAAA